MKKKINLAGALIGLVILLSAIVFFFKNFTSQTLAYKNAVKNMGIIAPITRSTENILDAMDSLGNALKHNLDVMKASKESAESAQEVSLRIHKVWKKLAWEYELVNGHKIEDINK